MFDAIVVRRTAPADNPGPLDLGRLAEAMLFYKNVRLVLTRHSLQQLLQQCGPDVALEIVANANVDAIYLDRDLAVKNEGLGTARERHRPVTIRLVSGGPNGSAESDESAIVRLFQEATGKSGRGRRLGRRFLNHVRSYDRSDDDVVDAVGSDWEDEGFIRRALPEIIGNVAPSYTVPSDLRVTLTRQDDGYFVFESNSTGRSSRWPMGPAKPRSPPETCLSAQSRCAKTLTSLPPSGPESRKTRSVQG